jgi:hypothetical protein
LEVFKAVHSFFTKDGRWPQYGVLDRYLDRECGIEDAAERLSGVPAHLLYTNRFALIDPPPDTVVGLTVAGLALCPNGERDLRLYLELLRWLAEIERTAAFEETTTEIRVDSEQIRGYLESEPLTPVDLRKMYALLRQDPTRIWTSLAGGDDEPWSITLSRGVRRYRRVEAVDDYLVIFNELMVGVAPAPPLLDDQVAPVPDEDGYEHDVALSFAGEDRPYVERVARGLKARGVRVFYDRFFEVDAWGAELPEFFDDAFRSKARFTVAFVSIHYAVKPWPTTERRSAFARALNQASPYLLPVRLDDTELPGLRPTVGFIDGRLRTPEQLVELVLAKLGQDDGEDVSPAFFGVPHSVEEEATLLALRPQFWEHLLFAGVLARGKRALDSKWHDHQLGYRTSGERLTNDATVVEYMSAAFDEGKRIAGNLDGLLRPDLQARAFGPPGEPGDPDLIIHLGQRILSMYEEFLDWASRMRSTQVPDRMETLRSIAATFVDEPIVECRGFIDSFVGQCERIPDLLAATEGGPITIEVHLILDISEETTSAYQKELRRLTRRR